MCDLDEVCVRVDYVRTTHELLQPTRPTNRARHTILLFVRRARLRLNVGLVAADGLMKSSVPDE